MHTGSTCFALFILLVAPTSIISENISISQEYLYEKGVNAYLENNYEDCVQYFEEAIDNYRGYTNRIENCRLKCHNEASLTDPLYHIDIEDLFFYEKTVKNTLCIIKCKNLDKNLFTEFNLAPAAVKLFEDRKPYEYLHACYFQIKEPQKAASAAFTFLVINPNDKGMVESLKYYTSLPEVDIEEIINYEAKDYVYLYVHGTDAYEEKSWDEVIQNMEESLVSYLQTEDECRAQCEGPFNQGWYPDLIPSIANHFTYSLRCKRKCKGKLSTLNGEKHEDLFPSHYHYLQYAYFKRKNLKAACQAVASYLLFYPHDETMLYNMEYYKQLPKVQDDFFQPRPEALRYIHRDNYEEILLSYIIKTFSVEVSTMKKESKLYKALYINSKRKLRFEIDDFISERECRLLLETAKKYSLVGDGYTGKISPHTIHENYSGLSLERVGMLVKYQLLDKKVLRTLVKISEEIKESIMAQFDVRKRLHFTYTHLVCRSSIPGSPNNRTDFSHAVHADNCNVEPDGQCPKKSPAFTWRDFTAILYLNGDFNGGELFFSKDPQGAHIEKIVQPICGRLVGFTSGIENLHGVKAITQGTRCALAVWFTYDYSNSEIKQRKLL